MLPQRPARANPSGSNPMLEFMEHAAHVSVGETDRSATRPDRSQPTMSAAPSMETG